LGTTKEHPLSAPAELVMQFPLRVSSLLKVELLNVALTLWLATRPDPVMPTKTPAPSEDPLSETLAFEVDWLEVD